MIFSVIVPFFNEESYLEKCLLAILDQDFKKDEYEIIFIDNGSTDSSAEIVKKYNKIILLHEKNGSDYSSRNKALKIAAGSLIAFTDADCIVASDWLKNIFEKLNTGKFDIVLGKRCFRKDADLALKIFEDYENEKVRYICNMQDKRYYFAFTNNMAARAEIFKGIDGFSEEYGTSGDTELLQRSLKKIPASRVTYLDNMKMIHMEIITVRNWLEKIYRYGSDNRKVELSLGYKPLTRKMNFAIYFISIKQRKYNIIILIYSLFWLAIGGICYTLGRMKNI